MARKLMWFRDQIKANESMETNSDPRFQDFQTKLVFSIEEIKSLIEL